MSTFKLLPNYSYDDYIMWEGRWEIIEGIAYAVSPMPSPRHQNLAGELHSLFLDSLKTKIGECKCKVYQPIDLKISEHTVLNPDLLVVCQPILKQFIDFAPELVVEILSPSTAIKDRSIKYDHYQEFGIPYYMIVDPETEKIEIYHLDASKTYQRLESKETTTFYFSNRCQITLSLVSLFND